VEGETRGGQAAEAKNPRVALPGASFEARVDLQGSLSLKSREGTPKSNIGAVRQLPRAGALRVTSLPR
jgi:hypothetical protein